MALQAWSSSRSAAEHRQCRPLAFSLLKETTLGEGPSQRTPLTTSLCAPAIAEVWLCWLQDCRCQRLPEPHKEVCLLLSESCVAGSHLHTGHSHKQPSCWQSCNMPGTFQQQPLYHSSAYDLQALGSTGTTPLLRCRDGVVVGEQQL